MHIHTYIYMTTRASTSGNTPRIYRRIHVPHRQRPQFAPPTHPLVETRLEYTDVYLYRTDNGRSSRRQHTHPTQASSSGNTPRIGANCTSGANCAHFFFPRCQYLYVCTSKASDLSTCALRTAAVTVGRIAPQVSVFVLLY